MTPRELSAQGVQSSVGSPVKTPPPRLGLAATPRRLVDNREMLALPLDQRAAFVLAQIDGKTQIRTLIDVTGFLPLEIIALVERLLELKAVAIV